MADFYGILEGNRGQVTRCGTSGSGVHATLASWDGALSVTLYKDENGRARFKMWQSRWEGAGVDEEICGGVVGEKFHLDPPELSSEEKAMVAMMRAGKGRGGE